MATEATKIPFVEAAAPATPAASRVVVYAKADGLIYSKDDAGVETLMSGGAGGGSVATDAIFDAKGDLAVGTGANTAAKLTAGANDTILMADSGQATGLKWVAAGTPTDQDYDDVASAGTADTYARGDHLHGMPSAGGGGGFTSSESRMSSDVTMTNSGTWYDSGLSLSLAAGTWIITGKVTMQCNHASGTALLARVTDGTTVWDIAEWGYQGGNAGQAQSVPFSARITLGSTTTVKVQGQDIARTGSKMLTTGNGPTANMEGVMVAMQSA